MEKLSGDTVWSLTKSIIVGQQNLADTSEKIEDMKYRLLAIGACCASILIINNQYESSVTWCNTHTSSYAGEILPTTNENGPSGRSSTRSIPILSYYG